MNGLASPDPVSTQHSSDGGGNCITAFSVLAQGPVAFPACPIVGDGPSVQVRLEEVSLKVAQEEGRRPQHATVSCPARVHLRSFRPA